MEARGVPIHNWFGDIRSRPAVVVQPRTVEDLVRIVTDSATYPPPVRAAGSLHSTTPCAMAEGGTLVDMRAMNRILEIGENTVTTEAGALYIDVAQALQRQRLQFYVNIELGNLSMGAAACTHTKEASFPGEFGMVASYAVGMKVVLPSGEIVEVTEQTPDLLQAMRSSFGLLGLVYEVTFRVKPLRPMRVMHRSVGIDELPGALPAMKTSGMALMYYLFPFRKRLVFEMRDYLDSGEPRPTRMWKIRNLAWKTVMPGTCATVRRFSPGSTVRDALLGRVDGVGHSMLSRLRADASSAPDQMIRYPERSGSSRYTFSIWAFPEQEFPRVLREYYELCGNHRRELGYRCDLANVGYRIAQDEQALLSYTYDWPAMTVDPVSTAGPGWTEFLDIYNDFCSRNGGAPLLNQTPRLTRAQVRKAFGDRIERFQEHRQRIDPEGRFVNPYFDELLGRAPAKVTATGANT